MIKSKIIGALKANKIKIPIWMGVLLARIPYSWRPIAGKVYKQRQKQFNLFTSMPTDWQKEVIFRQVYDIVNYSIENIPFYKKFYEEHGFSIDYLHSFEDITKIPIINKDDLMKYELSDRSNEQIDKILVNTGGSSGKTLSFYIEPSAIGHERFFVNQMRREINYKYYSVRLRLVGQSKVNNGVDYEFARNCYTLDMYQPFEQNKERLKTILQRHDIDFLQGYPSVLSEFADFCRENPDLHSLLTKCLKGVLYNSEYPYPIYRDNVESVFHVPSQAFYGHTERCIMAYEKNGVRNVYHPFQTYGYTEVIKREDGHFDLVGTSYYNHASPLIRYNTLDIVDNPKFENGILTSFEIIEGRSGQFVVDYAGKNISLTGLIMGRHHKLFDYCDHIQVMQEKPGKATILYVPRHNQVINNPDKLFDGSNVMIDFEFKAISQPIRTVNGKINLLVKDISTNK